jgi:hypothetical protein
VKCPDVAECFCLPDKPCELNKALTELEEAREALRNIATNPFTWQADIANAALSPNPEDKQ